MTQIEAGREALRRWQAARPDNFYAACPNLQTLLPMYLQKQELAAVQEALLRFGGACAQLIDPAALENDRIGNHPQLRRWDAAGRRVEEIVFHPTYHIAGKATYESGILARQQSPGHALEQAAHFFLLAHCGEMGHACPVACTSGLIRALQQKGEKVLQEKFLPPLLLADYEKHQIGAQFVTEVQGGSDVGANACVARPLADQPGMWRISGEKWFCSVANADQFLVSARPQGATAGTRGLGAFLVPRRLENGELNGLFIRRLKDKFGTRTLATAEIDFQDALAYQVGAIDEGFKIIIEMVLNVSRWFNAVGSCGLMHRALLEAQAFARHRVAFGAPIIQYPLVRETLAEIRASAYAGMASTFYLSHLIDKIDTGQADGEEKGVYRLLVNMNKYTTSVAASLALRRAQEILGGNGAVEEFSVIPRLYRDSVVFESWEGSHNVLCLQVLKDMQKYGLHEPYFAHFSRMLGGIDERSLAPLREVCVQAAAQISRKLNSVLAGSADYATLHIRRCVDEIMALTQAACLLRETQWALKTNGDAQKVSTVRFFINHRLVPGYSPLQDEAYGETIAACAGEAEPAS